jgi:hypothetical protein
MTTATDYYTQPDAEAMFVSIHLINYAEYAQEDGRTLSLQEQGILYFGNRQDVYICESCGDRKGWHWYGGPAEGSDVLCWEGHFYVLDEDGERIMCDRCYDEANPEPEDYDHWPTNPLDYLPSYTLAVMDYMERQHRIF